MIQFCDIIKVAIGVPMFASGIWANNVISDISEKMRKPVTHNRNKKCRNPETPACVTDSYDMQYLVTKTNRGNK